MLPNFVWRDLPLILSAAAKVDYDILLSALATK